MNITAYDLAARHIGIKERAGDLDHPLIQWWLSLGKFGFDAHDEVPWCSGFVNGISWLLNLPMSKSLAARSWLKVGTPVELGTAQRGFDVVILSRGSMPQPDETVIAAPGHVGFFDSYANGHVRVLGGNQSNAVSLESFPERRVLGVRRLA